MVYMAIFVLNVLDLLTTHLAVNVLQVATEANPLMAPIVGSWLIVPVKLIGAFLMAYLTYRARTKYPHWKLAKRVTVGVGVFYSVLVVHNTLVIILGVYYS